MVVAAPPPMPPAPRPIVRQPAAPLPYLAHSNIPVPLEGDEEETGLPVKMPSLEQSAQAYLRARTLDARVGAQMQQIHQRVTAHIPGIVEIKAASREVQQGLSLLKDRPSLRAALIASIILGPPKALAEG